MNEREENDWIERVAMRLRGAEALSVGFDRRVMDAVRTSVPPGASRLRRAGGWVVRRRPVLLSPLQALALAAGIAGLAVLGARLAWKTSGDRPAFEARAARHGLGDSTMVQFVLVAPTARSVALVGDFNDWNSQATPLRPASSNGVWTVSVPLAAGRHQYAFIVDGTRWMADPTAPAAVDEDFGVPSSVVTVVEPDRRGDRRS